MLKVILSSLVVFAVVGSASAAEPQKVDSQKATYGLISNNYHIDTILFFLENGGDLRDGLGPVDSTNGIRLYGNVNPQSAIGTITIEVWDSVARKTDKPYQHVYNVEPNATNLSLGSLTARGQVNGSEQIVFLVGAVQKTNWVGEVMFQNADGSSGVLGNFQVALHSMFTEL